ncbi:MAG: hypothetical protein ABW167_17835 [Baekduia sp.]
MLRIDVVVGVLAAGGSFGAGYALLGHGGTPDPATAATTQRAPVIKAELTAVTPELPLIARLRTDVASLPALPHPRPSTSTPPPTGGGSSSGGGGSSSGGGGSPGGGVVHGLGG